MTKSTLIGGVLLTIALVCGVVFGGMALLNRSSSTATERVVVLYPDDWNQGDFRNCWTGPNDDDTAKAVARAFSAAAGLPHLDCHFEAGSTPWHTFVMDVHFSGKKVTFDQQAWTCQRSPESLVCRN